MRRLLIIAVASLVALFLAVNGAFMLLSPRAWFGLPKWLRVSGNLSKGDHVSGLGALDVRIAGAAFLGIVAWVVYLISTGH